MDTAALSEMIDEMIRARVGYRAGGRDPAVGFDCEGWVRYLLKICGIQMAENIYLASKDFRLVQPPYQFLDVGVIRPLRSLQPLQRHLALFLDRRRVTHFSDIGPSKLDINRFLCQGTLSHVARHKSL